MIIVLIGIIGWLFYLLTRLNSLDAQVKNLSQELIKLKALLSAKAVAEEPAATSATPENCGLDYSGLRLAP